MGRRLVRDRALENWVVPGAEHQVRPVRDRLEHADLLNAKALEEVGELIFASTQSETLKELADVVTVCEAIAHVCGIAWEQVLRQVEVRLAQSGGFTEGLVWETSR